MCALVINAQQVKNVPGSKTDIGDGQWLATLVRTIVKAIFTGHNYSTTVQSNPYFFFPQKISWVFTLKISKDSQ